MKKIGIILVCLLLLVGCGEKKEESNNQTTTSSNTTTTKIDEQITTTTTTTTKSTTTTTMKKLGTNEYIALKDNKIHKYSYIYPTKNDCEIATKGENLGDSFPYDEKIYQFLSCEEVKDQKEKHYWGIYFITSYTENTGFYY